MLRTRTWKYKDEWQAVVQITAENCARRARTYLGSCRLGKCLWESQGRIQEFFQGGLKFFFIFPGGSAPVGAWKPAEINRFHWSRGGLRPHNPPEYAPGESIPNAVWVINHSNWQNPENAHLRFLSFSGKIYYWETIMK